MTSTAAKLAQAAKQAKKPAIAQKVSSSSAPQSLKAKPRASAPAQLNLTPKQEAFPLTGRSAWKLVRGLYYVYTLSVSGAIFYVGKGKGGRMLQHEASARKSGVGEKHQFIRGAISSGLEVEYQIVGAFDMESDAYALEAKLIQSTAGLKNIVLNGLNSMTSEQKHRAHLARLLERMKPWRQWRDSITPAQHRFLEVFGMSPRRFYALMRTKCKQQAEGRDPNIIFLRGLKLNIEFEA